MLQNINLYRPEFQPRQPKVSARTILVTVLAGGVVLMGVSLYLLLQHSDLENQVAQLNQQELEAATRLQDFAKLHPPIEKDVGLESQIVSLVAELGTKQKILEKLSSNQLGNTAGFAKIFEGFAQGKVAGVWLEKIGISSGGDHLLVTGRAVHSEAVPRFLRALSNRAEFNGRKFRTFDIQANPEVGGLTFQINTEEPELKKEPRKAKQAEQKS